MPSVHLAGQEPAQQTCPPSCLLRLKAPTQSPLSPFVAPSNAATSHSPASNLPSKLANRLPASLTTLTARPVKSPLALAAPGCSPPRDYAERTIMQSRGG